MPLRSRLFQGNAPLEACLVQDAAHVTPGAVGVHVQLVQRALCYLGARGIAGDEYRHGRYGPSTAAAGRAYKQRRAIINYAYQTAADNIVGKMTVSRLDEELRLVQDVPARPSV